MKGVGAKVSSTGTAFEAVLRLPFADATSWPWGG